MHSILQLNDLNQSRHSILKKIIVALIRSPVHLLISQQLQRFWRQLLADRSYYVTACGLCTIDRQILTSICACATTYLIILIQFAKT